MALITSTWSLDALILVLVALLSVYSYMTRNYNYWTKRGVKQVPPVFPFGNILALLLAKENPLKLFTRVYKYGEGERMTGFYFFDKPYLLLRDPELIKTILVKDFYNFSNKVLTGNTNDSFGEHNIFTATNPPWKFIRNKLTPAFTSGKLKNMLSLMLEICEEFDVYMENLNIDEKVGRPIEVKETLAKFMTDIIGTTAFGMRFNALKNQKSEFRHYGKAMWRHTYIRYWQILAIFLIPQLRKITNAQFFDVEGSKFLRKSFWDVINERVKTGIKRPDLIEILIEIMKEQEDDPPNVYKLEGDALVAQAAVFFTGGFETTSTLTSFTMYELAKNQEIQTRLRNEIFKGLEKTDGKLTYDLIMTLPYLSMVINETLRIYPVGPYVDRIPDEDYTFPGTNVTIDKRTPIICPIRAIHMDPKYFPNPEKYDPERFSEENKNNIAPFTYFPFGGGPRGCIGVRLGMLQSKLALIKFISKYELTFCEQTPDPIQLNHFTVLTHSAGGLYLNLRKLVS